MAGLGRVSGVTFVTPEGCSGVQTRTPESHSLGRSVAPRPGGGRMVGVLVHVRWAAKVPVPVILLRLRRNGPHGLGTGGCVDPDAVRPVLRCLRAFLGADGVSAALGNPEFLKPRNPRRGPEEPGEGQCPSDTGRLGTLDGRGCLRSGAIAPGDFGIAGE